MKIQDTRSIATQLLERLGAADAEGVQALFAEKIDWFVPGSTALPWVGPRTRRGQVASFFHEMWSHFEPGKSEARVDKVLVEGEDAVIIGHFIHQVASTGKKLSTPMVMDLTIRAGEIVRLHLYEDTLAVARAFDRAPEGPNTACSPSENHHDQKA